MVRPTPGCNVPSIPSTAPLPWKDAPPREVDLLVVGGGFAGLMTATHVRAALPEARIAVVERQPRMAPGVAYGACHAAHLLNVPAERMGVSPEDPAGFIKWLHGHESQGLGEGRRVAGDEFVPRFAFGRYLNDLFRSRLAAAGSLTALVRGEVVGLSTHADGSVTATLDSGERIEARAALLALGLPAAGAPWEGRTEQVAPEALIADPWAPGALEVPPREAVLVLGSGLTAIDAVLALRRHGHRGRITMLSRNGRLPCPHAQPGGPPFAFDRPLAGRSAREVFRVVRQAAKARAAAGLGWHAVIDAIRPQTAAVWRSWSDAERGRFLRRLRPCWEVHRHRAPTEVLAEVEALRERGTLEVACGELLLATGLADGRVRAVATERRGSARHTREIVVGRLINCAGPAMDLARSRDPLLRALLAEGIAAVDAHGLGLRADGMGRVLPGRPGTSCAAANLLLVGALRRGDLWESTAIPELRVQAAEAASAIIDVIRTRTAAAGARSGMSGERPAQALDRSAAGSPGDHSAVAPIAAPTRPAGGPREPGRPLPRRDATASPPAALKPLLDRLRTFHEPVPYPTLVELLRQHSVTAAELGDTIQIDGAAYVRTLVFLTEHVELLVMAWLPGQCSPIHDHAGSGCAVRVVAGSALERLYERDADGYVIPGGERTIGPGEVTGAIDEDIHAMGNAVASPAPPSSILVTLHAYSPPLRPTRKYELRPGAAARAPAVQVHAVQVHAVRACTAH